MVKIAVFDSGLGSLSIIKEIQKITKSEIIYFADQKNYPYGKKSQAQLRTVIQKTIKLLEKDHFFLFLAEILAEIQYKNIPKHGMSKKLMMININVD